MVTNGDVVKVLVGKTSEYGPILKRLAEKQVVGIMIMGRGLC
ncbi:hypothetical protein DOT_2425 [Desulfosporosinus sp. OT]|nr:hypothetical protein DOT_2425 [Desulfosporosinus sp. OT]